jgi:hypothetical protein
MSCLDGLVQTYLISKWPRCLQVMLRWFSAEPSYLKWPIFLHVMLRWFSADPSYLLNGQDVYMSCLDGLVQTYLISKWPRCLQIMLRWFSAEPSYLTCPIFLHVMLRWFSADPSYILHAQDVYISCLDGLVPTHLVS